MSYADILRQSNLDTWLNPNGSGFYELTWTILDSTGDVLGVDFLGSNDYYGSGSEEETKLVTTFPSSISTALTTIFTPDDYTVYFGDVAKVTFTNDTNAAIAIGMVTNAYSQFGDPDIYAFAYDYHASLQPSVGKYGDIWFNQSAAFGWSGAAAGSVQFYTVLHELGHSLGLTHSVISGEDTHKFSVMTETPDDTHPEMVGVMPAGLQLLDIQALQSIYGANYATRSGNTTYAMGAGFAASDTGFIYTIWDGAGTDDIDGFGYSTGVQIDLRQGHFSSIGQDGASSPVDWDTFPLLGGVADKGNVAIAIGAVIEDAQGTNQADSIIGNAWENTLTGGEGDDKLYGDGFVYDGDDGEWESDSPDGNAPVIEEDNDVLDPGLGTDESYGGTGNDLFYAIDSSGTLEEDIYHGGGIEGKELDAPGSEIFYPDDGSDTVDYAGVDLSQGILFDISDESNGTATSWNGATTTGLSDTLISIENIIATEYADKIIGNAAANSLSGGGGNDIIVGGKGDDTLSGGAGADTFIYDLGDGDDIITDDSWESNDTFQFGAGVSAANTIVTFDGDDMVFTFVDGSTVTFQDYLTADQASTDNLDFTDGDLTWRSAAAGNTSINGTAASEVLIGSSGNNIIAGSYGSDTIYGGAGNDTLWGFGSSAVPDLVQNRLYGGAGDDFLNYGGLSDILDGGEGNDTIYGNGSVRISAGAGNDRVKAVSSTETIYLGDGADSFSFLTVRVHGTTYEGGSLTIEGGAGNDFMHLANGYHNRHFNHSIAWLDESGNDKYEFAHSTHIITDLAGNDTYILGSGDINYISDTGGTDRLIITETYEGNYITKQVSGLDLILTFTREKDNLSFSLASTFVVENYFDESGEYKIEEYQLNSEYGAVRDFQELISHYFGTGGADTYTATLEDFLYGNGGNDTLTGNSNADTISGGNDNDTIDGQAGDDAINGDAGTDTLNGGSGNDYMLGGAGNDTVDGDGDNDLIYGQAGDDTLIGDTGNDTLYGATENDTLSGGSGDDTLVGGSGDDTMEGGADNDTYIYHLGVDTITEASGVDVIHLDDTWTSTTPADYARDVNNLVITLAVGHTITIANFYFGTGNVVESLEYADSTTVDLAILFDATQGDSGNNTLNGTSGDDIIFGNGGDDTITGGAGNDTLIGGADDDALSGGADNDDYIYDAGQDTVTETSGTDAIELDAVWDGVVPSFEVSGDNLVITFSSTNTITVVDFFLGGGSVVESVLFADTTSISLTPLVSGTQGDGSPNTLNGTSGADVIFGNGGDDVVTGSDDADSLFGGDNDDTLTGGSGDDVLDGGDGEDTVVYSGSVTVNLAAGTATGDGTDTLASIENVIADGGTLIGNDSDNILETTATSAIFVGGGGNDTIIGGDPLSDLLDDWLDYSDAHSSILISIAAGVASIDGDGGADTFTGIDHIHGSEFADIIIGGNGGLNRLYGGGGNDTVYTGFSGASSIIDGGAGDDSMYGGDGADNFYGSLGSNFIDGGNGYDTLTYVDYISAGVTVNLALGVAASSGLFNDTFFSIEGVNGSSYDDVLIADDSANILNGYAGDDVIFGGSGDDAISGHFGNDIVHGGDDNDGFTPGADASGLSPLIVSTGFILFRDHADYLTLVDTNDESPYGTDLIYNDVENIVFDDVSLDLTMMTFAIGVDVWGTPATISGGSGEQALAGSAGDDDISGGADSDALDGGGGDDVLDGGTGDDTLTGGDGDDTIDGGDDNDTLVAGHGGGNDDYDGGSGIDTITFTSTTLGITVNLAAGSNHATGTEIDTDQIANVENVTGGSGNDTISGNSAANVLLGGAGNDTLKGAAGNDTLTGGDGTDTADYTSAASGVTANLSSGTSSNDGDSGSDTLSGIENLTGSSSADTFTGDGIANVLIGNGGADSLTGGAGNDTLRGGTGNDTIDGGTDTDTVDYSTAAAAVTVNLGSGTASNDGDGGSDTLSNIENVIGSAYNDSITGSNSSNLLNGGAGNDTISGSGADDTIIGGAGNDTISGNGNTDTVDYSGAAGGINVSLVAGGTTSGGDGDGGTDTISSVENITGSAYADTITGSTSANTLSGLAGNDTISGDSGNDILMGGAGNDSLDGGSNTDTASYSLAASGVNATLGSGTTSGGDGDGGTDTFTGIENLTGSDHADTLNGDGNANTILGGAGNDTLRGGAGNDTLNGGTDTDTVTYSTAAAAVTVNLSSGTASNDGDGGSDTISQIENIIGSAYNDTLTGNTSSNVFYGGAGNDTITGGSGANFDTIDYSAAASGITITLGSGTTSNDGDGGSDTFSGIEYIVGSAYADTITAANTVWGGAGNDTITFSGNGSVYAGPGDDTVYAVSGNVIIYDDAGDDTYDGTSSTHTTISYYETATMAIAADLGAGTVDVDGDSVTDDSLTAVDGIIATDYDDTLTGSTSADYILHGMGGNDTIIGNAGNDDLDGGDGDDAIDGGDGHDEITGGAGFNILIGGNDNDTFIVHGGYDLIDGGSGNDDEVDYRSSTIAVLVNLALGVADEGLDQTLDDEITGVEDIEGSGFDDSITGNDDNNSLSGNDGNDSLSGQAGDDILAGGDGNDFYVYDSGLDTVLDTGGTDILFVAGVTINDITVSNHGTDEAKIVVTASTDEIIVNDLRNASAAKHIDYIQFGDGFITGLPDYASWSIGTASGETINGTSGANTIVAKAGNDTVNADSGADDAHGGTGDDTLNGGAGNDLLHGGDDDDIVNGEGDNDTLFGGNGDDALDGGTGDDTLYGQDGQDDLWGGDGVDTFVLQFASLPVVDVLKDFDTGEDDAIDLSDLLSGWFDPLDDLITDFVQITTNGSDSEIRVDITGTANFGAGTHIATIEGVTGLTDEVALVTSGHLLAA